MKKFFTLIAVAALAVSANAQTKWLSGVTADDAAAAGAVYAEGGAYEGTPSEGYKAKPVNIAPGLSGPATVINADLSKLVVKNDKVLPGLYVPYFTPTIAEGDIKTLDGASSSDAYVEFYEEIIDENDFEHFTSVEFDATRIGTDAVRVNVKFAFQDENYETPFLVNEDNWQTVTTNAAWFAPAEDGSVIEGLQPARNKDDVNAVADSWKSHFNIPRPADFPANAYGLTVKVYVYGIHNNKNCAIYNVKVNHEGEATAVAGVSEAQQSAKVLKTVDGIIKNGVKYNYAGQMVK